MVCLCLVGCSDEVTMPSAGQLMEFENAGPLRPAVDMNRLVRARIGGGPYRVVNGDVLELTMPALLLAVTHEQAAGTDKAAPYMCRIGDGGTVTLPLVGDPLYIQKKRKRAADEKLGRLFLHSTKLSFTDLQGVKQTFESPLPTELELFLTKLP